MNGHCGIEGVVVEGKSRCIAVDEFDFVLLTDPARDGRGGIAERTRQIEPDDLAPLEFGKRPRWPSKTAPDVEDAFARPDVQGFGQFDGGGASPDVKLVDGRKVARVSCDSCLPACRNLAAMSSARLSPVA